MGNSNTAFSKDEGCCEIEDVAALVQDRTYASGSDAVALSFVDCHSTWRCAAISSWRQKDPSEIEALEDEMVNARLEDDDAVLGELANQPSAEYHFGKPRRVPSTPSTASRTSRDRDSKKSTGSRTEQKVLTLSAAVPDGDYDIDWDNVKVPVAEPFDDLYAGSEPNSPASPLLSPGGRDASPKSPGGRKSRKSIKPRMTDKLATVVSVALQVIIENPGKIQDYYSIGSILGEGSFGTVRKGKVKATQASRAVKVISKERMKDRNSLVQNEIETLKMSDHPNVVRLYEIFEDGHNIFLVMEVCRGGSLQHKVDNVGVYSEGESAMALQQILRGVYYLHKCGIAHRDLKPENCLLSKDADGSHMKLVDFGLATKFKPGQIFRQQVGTKSLMAPEIFGKKYQADVVDMWSVGCICYYTMCGEFPFEGQNEEETIERIKVGRLAFDKKEFVDISKECISFVKSFLEFSPGARVIAKEALNHEWIQKKVRKSKHFKQPLSPQLIENLKNFRALNKLKRAALSVIASMLSDNVLRQGREAFISLDADGDGHLSVRELQERLNRTMKPDKQFRRSDVNKIFEDREKSEVLYKTFSYTEFLAATFDRGKLTDEVLRAAFTIFDKDQSQTISMQELVEGHLLGHLDEKDLTQTLEDLDTNGDNYLDYDEFAKMMRTSM